MMMRALAAAIPPSARLFLCLLLGLLAVGRERMLRDPGTFWHTVVGQQILATGQLPREDVFSFTAGGQKWLAQQWLGELAMALIHRLAGLDGLLLVACALISGVFTWLAMRLRRAGLAWPAVLPLVLLGLGAASCHFMPRPHLASIALIGAGYAILCDVESNRRGPRTLLWLPALMVLWTNTHGAALGGLATILICCFGWLLFTRISRPLIGLTAALCILAVLINPYGAALPAVWIGLMRSDVLPRLIVEHAALVWTSPEGMMVLALGAIYIGLLIHVRGAGWRITWLLPLVWFALALSRVRHAPLFAVTALLGISEMLPALAAQRRDLRPAWLDPAAAGISPSPRPIAATLIPALCVLSALCIQHVGLRLPLVGAGWARPGSAYWPSTTLTALRDRLGRSPENPRVFNDMLFGGYLILHVPEARVFIDDRCELYGDAGLLEYARICGDAQRLTARCQYDDIRIALVAAGSRLERHLRADQRWRSVAVDPAARLYQRVD